MREPSDLVTFDDGRPVEIVEHMRRLADAGTGWINLQADVEDDGSDRTASGAFRVFSARGPGVPLCTWVARERTRKQVEYVSVGIQHGSGPKAVARLEEQGHGVPEGWLVLQDHSKRGLVVGLPVTAAHDDVLRWLVLAARLLSSQPLPSRWHAAVYG